MVIHVLFIEESEVKKIHSEDKKKRKSLKNRRSDEVQSVVDQ